MVDLFCFSLLFRNFRNTQTSFFVVDNQDHCRDLFCLCFALLSAQHSSSHDSFYDYGFDSLIVR